MQYSLFIFNKLKLLTAVIFLSVLVTVSVNAQVDVTSTGGTPAASYSTLKGAFDAINAGTHTGSITIGISANTDEGTATATLNASGSGSASYTDITISPTGGAARTISGATTAGNPMIDFNGADNVTIDGLNSGGNSLTIQNTTASATSGTSTIRFINGATNNTITKCSLKGSVSSSVATNGATIFFSTDGSTANGNDNNTISYCDIGPAGSNLPTKAILGNGSTTSTTIHNSGIVINNNNIFDYFGAAVTSAGIAINGGCNTWTITNNKFYQTGTRTWTTGAEHNAMLFNNSGVTAGPFAMTITGNIIGYASSSQTGTYTLTGSTGIFRAIRFNGPTGLTVSNINSNTIASVSLTGVTSSGTGTSSPFLAILIINGLVNTNSNTIGSQTATGSLTFSTTTSSSVDVYAFYNFSLDDWTANSNNIGGISVTNLGSGTTLFYGLRANTSTSKVFNASSNNVGGTVANSIQLSASGTSSQVIGIWTNNAIATWTSNNVRNMTTNAGTGTTTSASMIGLLLNTTSVNQTVSQNIIYNLNNTNTTAATVVTGIQFTGSTANVVERNLIYGLTTSTNSSSAEVNGIRIAGGTTTYRNNMIVLGAGISNAIGGAATNSSTVGIVGINEALGTNNIYHNSIYIGGTATAGSGSSYAFNGVQTTVTRAFRNNIFFNARTNSGATGKHYAIKINGTAPNPTGLTLDNNVYYVTGSGGVFGFFNSADVASLFAWKGAVGQDGASIYGDPKYLDPTSTPPDLHINSEEITVIEGNGADVGVTNDYDGESRAGLTPVDIGADAGDFLGTDLAPPNITYTAFGGNYNTTSRTLSGINISDLSGINVTPGTAPRLYFKKSTDANSSSGWKYVETEDVASPFSFTITYSSLNDGSVSVGDVIQYFVVAQDNSVNNNVGLFAGTPNQELTSVALSGSDFPVTGTYSYSITDPPLSGDYTVGTTLFNRVTGRNIYFNTNVTKVMKEVDVTVPASERIRKGEIAEELNLADYTVKQWMEVEEVTVTPMENGQIYTGPLYVLKNEYPNLNYPEGVEGVYSTLTAAVNALNTRGVSGAVRFLLTDATYSTGTGETFPITVNISADDKPTASNTVTIKPNTDVTSTITGSVASNPVITIRNNYIIIDGSNTVAGTTRNLTISNTSTTSPQVVRIASTGTTPVTNVTVKNAIIINGVNTSSALVMLATDGTVGYYNNITIENNSVQKAYIGIYVGCVAASGNGTGIVVTKNDLNSSGSNAIRYVGIYVQGADGAVISSNTIGNFDGASSENDRGIWIASNTKNSNVNLNKIYTIKYTGTGGYGAYAIAVSSALSSSNNSVFNNVIYDISGDGWDYTTVPTDNPFGIIAFGGQSGLKIYYNSINLYGNTINQTSGISVGIGLGEGTIADIRNNSIVNNLGLSGATGYGAIGIFAQSDNTQFTTINYNDYYVSPTGSGVKALGQLATTAYTTLSGWQGASGQDGSSISADPQYQSNTDLRPSISSPLLGAGTSISGITTDFLGVTRDGSTPTIGAYEEGTDIAGPTISYTALGNTYSLANRLLSGVTLTDPSGVDWTNAPRIYFKKSTDNNVFGGNTSTDNGWKWTATTTGSSPATFIIDYSIINGGSVSPGDVVQYFVVAQDLFGTPNVSSNPSAGFVGTSVSSITSAPTTPNSYTLVETPLAGDYTVGTAMFNRVSGRNIYFETKVTRVMKEVEVEEAIDDTKKEETSSDAVDMNPVVSTERPIKKVLMEVEEYTAIPMENGQVYNGPLELLKNSDPNYNYPEGVEGVYATITAALNALNPRGVSAPVRFLLTDGTYSTVTGETFPLVIDIVATDLPNATNTVTIRPQASVTSTITGSSSTSIFKLNGADYIIIDGSNSGGSDKNLTITNSSTASNTAAIWLATKGTGAGATYNTIKNCNISTGSIAATNYGVYIGGTTISTTGGADNDNNTVSNNNITVTPNGIFAVGTASTSTGGLDNLLISGNSVTCSTSVAAIGIRVGNALNSEITGNELDIQQSVSNAPVGISLETGANNILVHKNTVKRSKYTGTLGYGGRGITVGTALTESNITLANNVVYGVNGDNWSSFGNSSSIGIAIGVVGNSSTLTTTTRGVKLYYNTVNLSGTYSRTLTSCITTALYIGSGASNLDIRDNIFANSLDNTGNATSKSYAIYSAATDTGYNQINFNDYYASGPEGVLGFLASDKTTLSAWKDATGKDGNSISANPEFFAETDLRPDDYLSPVINAGTPITGYTTDFNGETRSGSTPTIGAYENSARKTFTGDGNLNDAGNWVGGLPSSGSHVSIRGNCVIPDKTNNTFFGTLGDFKVQTGGSLNMTTFQFPGSRELINNGYVQTQSKVTDPLPPNTNYGGTVEYNGVSKYIASNSTYNNLILSGTAAKAMTGDVTVNGVFTMDGTETLTGMQVKVNDNTLTINGSVNFVGLTKIGTTLGSSLVLGESVALREGLLPKNYISEETIRAHAEEYGDAEDNLVVTNEEDAEDAESLTANETPIVVEKRVRDNNTPEAVFELPAMKLGNLTVNRTDGVKMLGSITVDGTLSLLKGTFDFDAFKLTVNGAVNKTTGNWSSDGVNAAIIIGGTGETPVDVYAVNLKALTVNRPSGITLRGAVGVATKATLNGLVAISGGSLVGGEKTQILVGGSGSAVLIPPCSVMAVVVDRDGGATLNSGTLNIAKKLYLTNGTFTVNPAATLALAMKTAIYRTSGTLSGTYTPDATVGLVYQGGSHINMGSEVPVGADVVMLTMGNTGGLTLNSNMSLNAALSITGGNFDIKNNTLTLGATKGSITETSGELISSTSNGLVVKEYNWKMMNDPTNVAGLGITVSSPKKLGLSTVTRGFTPLVVGEGDLGISRWYKIEPTVNTALNATIFFRYKDSELGEINEDDLALWLSTDDGASWTNIGGSVNTGANTISVSGVNQVGLITAASTFAMSASRNINVISFDASVSKKTVTFEVLTQDVTGDLFIEKLTTKEGETDSWTTIGQAEMVKTFEKENPDGNQVSTVQSFTFVENSVEKGIYQYRLKNVDSRGRVKYSENTIEVEVEGIPTEYALMQNYPNPFNPTTRIKYQLPLDGKVVIELYSVTGEKVADLVNSELTAGYYTLDVNAASLNLTSGVYIYRIVANNLETGDKFVSVKKMMLIK